MKASRLLPIRRLTQMQEDDHLEALCRRLNVENMRLQPGSPIPPMVNLRVLKDAHIPSHVLAVFDIPESEWESSYCPILVPIRADLYTRDFRTKIIPLSPPGTPYPIPYASPHSGGQLVTLPVVPVQVPHAPSIPLLLLFGLGLESRPQVLYPRLLPPEVVAEFPALPTMTHLMCQLCSDRELANYIAFNQGLWKNMLSLGPRDPEFVSIVRTAWNVTVEARRLRQHTASKRSIRLETSPSPSRPGSAPST